MSITDDATVSSLDGEAPGRKKQFRWKVIHDLALAKEVDSVRPFTKQGRRVTESWTEIAATINQLFDEAKVDHLAVSRHFNLIVTNYRKKDTQNRQKSGTEEEISQLDAVLSRLVSLIDDDKLQKEITCEVKQQKVDDQKAQAESVRKAAATTIKRKLDGSDNGEAPQKRVSDASLISLWTDKQAADRDRENRKQEIEVERFNQEKEEREKDRKLKELELQLAQEKMNLERDQFEHQREKDKEEFKIRVRALELQEQERKSQLETQNTLLQLLLNKNK